MLLHTYLLCSILKVVIIVWRIFAFLYYLLVITVLILNNSLISSSVHSSKDVRTKECLKMTFFQVYCTSSQLFSFMNIPLCDINTTLNKHP